MLTSCSKRLMFHDPSAAWSMRLSHGGYDDVIRDVSWSDDGKYLLQVNPKGLIEILSATDMEIKSLQYVPLRDTWAACFHREGHRNIAVGCKTGQVSIWDTRFKHPIKQFPIPAQPAAVNIISYNAKNTNVAATMQNGDTVIYGTTSNSPVQTVRVPRSKSISAMKFHHESRSILGLATDEGHVLLRDIATNKDKVFFKSIHTSPVSDIAYSLINRDVLLSCGYDKVVRIYDVRMESVISNIETSYPLTSVATNVENQVALGTKKGVLLVYDLRDLGTPVAVINDHTEEISCVTFQPLRKRNVQTELSLKEETIQTLSPQQCRSPLSARIPDLFLVGDTPSPKTQSDSLSRHEVDRPDSFLFKLGLDKSTADESFILKNSTDLKLEHKHNTGNLQTQKWDTESVAKSSTPLAGKMNEHLLTPSSFCAPLVNEQMTSEYVLNRTLPPEETQSDPGNSQALIRELCKELREMFTMSITDLAEDNRNYYLSLLMQHTKQKLFMEKQLSNIALQMQVMQRNQDILSEENRQLIMEIELLKASSKHNNL